ncbi:hypothetical protein HDU96_007849 [Phlyctochytrium bullatum]|nr:hypothetical protein HDU96_007849 [Phlyctochytrium bullatum]
MSHAALKWVSCVVDIETINIGTYDKRCIIIHGLEQAKRKYPIMDEFKFETKADKPSPASIAMYKNFINDSALFKLQADINQSRLFRLESNLSNLLELYELRQVTTVFMRLDESITRWDRKDALSHTQNAISIVQSALKKYEGSLRQVHVDDKGAVILAFFGLPPLAHQNDASHGVKAVLEIRDQFSQIMDEFAIGITTGIVSIGGVGNMSRTEYAVMGDSINMAARLMCHPEAASSVLCDEKTYNLCEHEFVFEKLGETRVKGKAAPIPVFRPTLMRLDVGRAARRAAHKIEPIGRVKEKNAIKTVLSSWKDEETSGVVIVEADGGQGISTLLDFAKEEALRQRCHIWLRGPALSIVERTTSMGVANAAASTVGVSNVETTAARQSVQPGKIRMKEFSELIRRIVNAISMTNPLTLIFNETQWMDTLSWELLWEIVNTCPKTAVLIFSRPERTFDNEDRVSLFRKFKRLPRALSLRIDGLSFEETKQMVVATWPGKPIRNVANSIVENIYRRTNGNPLYIKSLVVAWKDSGQYRIDKDGVLSPQSAEFDFESIVVGYDLKSIVVAHFDRLDRDFQLFLKVSSVLGQRFLLEDALYFLSDIPGYREMLGGTIAAIAKNVEEMDKHGYLQRVEGDIDGLYFQFKSAVVRNCIYSMMNESQRQQLHLRIARHYERMLSPENSHRLLIPLYEHYKETGNGHKLKILQYLEEVCHFYYQKHSMTDAIKHYNLLLQKTREYQYEVSSITYDKNMVSRWNRELGEAYFSRGDVFEARPMADKWLESYAALPRCDDAATKAELARLVSSTPEYAILHNIRLSLMTLAEVKLATEAMAQFKYAIVSGLNICEKFPRDPLYARYLAITGYMLWLLEYRRGLSLRYLDAADKSDNRSDLSYSTQILAYTARTLFLMGLWDEGMKRYETVLYLNPVAGDISMREESMRMPGSKYLRLVRGLAIAEPLRALNDGVIDIFRNCRARAVRKWKAGLTANKIEFMQYIQALLQERIAKYSDNPEDADQHLRDAQRIYRRIGATWDCDRISLF